MKNSIQQFGNLDTSTSKIVNSLPNPKEKCSNGDNPSVVGGKLYLTGLWEKTKTAAYEQAAALRN